MFNVCDDTLKIFLYVFSGATNVPRLNVDFRPDFAVFGMNTEWGVGIFSHLSAHILAPCGFHLAQIEKRLFPLHLAHL